MQTTNTGLLRWKLRRVAAGKRQQDVARSAGISLSRYSAIERGDVIPNELDRQMIEKALPAMPNLNGGDTRSLL